MLWERLLLCIGNEGRDALFEALVATRSQNRKQATGLQHASIFEPLFQAFAAKGDSRNAFMSRYPKDWYSALKHAYWIGTHTRLDGGFFGYWAVEVAGVVAAFHIDDTTFRDLVYYPKDLIG